MTSRIDLSDGHHLAYAEHGEGEPLIFLHGGGLDHRMWAPQMSAFPGYRVITPDARGHGDSSTPTAAYRLVDDVVTLLDRLSLRSVVVVGLSMGGGTAVDLAVDYPERVRALVVSGTGTSDPDFRDPWVLDILDTWQRAMQDQDPEAWIEGFARFLPGPHRNPGQVDPALQAANDAMVRHTLNTHILPVVSAGRPPVQAIPVEDVNDRRRAITAPVLAIIGGADADDHIRFARELLDHVADAREVVVSNTGHYPNLERPDLFNAAIRNFLTEIEN